MPIRNGHFLGTQITTVPQRGTSLRGGTPTPDDANAIDTWNDWSGGDRKITYTIEVFETAEPPQHMWMPVGSEGYKTLWKQSIEVSATEAEIRAKAVATAPAARIGACCRSHITPGHSGARDVASKIAPPRAGPDRMARKRRFN